MKEALLLSFGIICILFGAIGVSAVGVAYYYTERALSGLPSDIERLYAVTSQTTNDTKAALWNASISVMTAANDLQDVPFLGGLGRNTANSLRKTAASGMQLTGDVGMVSGYLEDGKDILLDGISSIRLTAQITFGWLGVLHVLFIMIGVSILHIRRSLQSSINMYKT